MGQNLHGVPLRCLKTRDENERCIFFSLNISLLKSKYLFFGAPFHTFAVCSALDHHYLFWPADEEMLYAPIYPIILLDLSFIDHGLKRGQRGHSQNHNIRG